MGDQRCHQYQTDDSSLAGLNKQLTLDDMRATVNPLVATIRANQKTAVIGLIEFYQISMDEIIARRDERNMVFIVLECGHYIDSVYIPETNPRWMLRAYRKHHRFEHLMSECLKCNSVSYYHPLQVQSEDIVGQDVVDESMVDKSQNEVVEFIDVNRGALSGFSGFMSSVALVDKTPQVDLARFLSRPVKISTATWTESDISGAQYNFDPWFSFFNDTRIKKKLDNFSFLQCDLKLKFMVNASPFYYGMQWANYQPLPNLTPTTIVHDAGTRWLIPLSQRPMLKILPQKNEGGEMTLPYFNFRNWIRIQKAQDFHDMGKIDVTTIVPLRSANGATSTVTVQVYAWAENVHISGPSVGLALQSSDEYGEGVVSAPASAIANFASYLKNVPIIGKFATATEIGATAVSTIASMFGWTNVPVISDTQPFRPGCFPQLASSEIGYPIEKLTLDPKNELSVDPSVVGLPSTDELSISHLVQKESYLTQASWDTTNVVDDILFTTVVTPYMFDSDLAAQAKIQQTVPCWIANMFTNWRGDMIIRGEVIASPFHKGRLRITYDPTGYAGDNIVNDSVSSTVCFTTIVDLSVDTDFEIRIPYQQAISWLVCNTGFGTVPFSTSLTPPFNYNSTFHNGTLTMRVLTTLTAPATTAPVNIVMYVRGADNVEFANPIDISANLTPLAVQSMDVYGAPMEVLAGAQAHEPVPERYLVNFGEMIGSLRQLLRRSHLSYVSTSGNQAFLNTWTLNKEVFSKWPFYYGYDPSGIHSAKGLVAPASSFNFNFVKMTPYNWIAPAFIGQRGSGIWHFNIDNLSAVSQVRVYRQPQISATAGNTYSGVLQGTISADAKGFLAITEQGSGGQTVINQLTQAGVSVLCPNYNQYRFQSTNPLNPTHMYSVDGSDRDSYVLEISEDSSGRSPTSGKVWHYHSVGTDFNLHFFLNVPTITLYSGVPVAN